MKAERRNITVTNETVSVTLDRAENASKFIEKCILYYIEENEKEYALLEDLNQLEDKVEILNKNYLQTRDTLNKLVDSLFGREQ